MNSILKIKDLTITASGKTILDSLDLSVNSGDFIMLLGSNGCGKSTLIKAINGLMPNTKGSIYLQNDDISQMPIHKRAKKIVTLTQDLNLSSFEDLSILENFQLIIEREKTRHRFFLSKNLINQIKDHLDGFHPTLSKRLDSKVKFLSGGERQMLILAMHLLFPPEILLLDEHTSALDPMMSDQLMKISCDFIKNANITTIAITHDINIALNYGNRLVALKHGKVFMDVCNDDKVRMKKEDILAIYG